MLRKRKILSTILNFLIAVAALTGVTLSLAFSERDGYSPWPIRLLYFTQQSNLWIGVTCLIVAIFYLHGLLSGKQTDMRLLHSLKFIFTVSITITCVIFCSFLAPFADFNVWSFASVLTHIAVPVLSVVDLFTNQSMTAPSRAHSLLAVIPPLLYFFVTVNLCIMRVDFGRGDPYPYFFLNFYSPVGLFGADFSGELPSLGSFYWIAFIILIIIGIGLLYRYLLSVTTKHRLH